MTALLHRLRALHHTHRKAFTALEVLLVVTLVFVVAVIGFPSVQEAKPRSSVRAVAMQLAEDLRLARQTAIAKNMPVGVLFPNENGTKAVTRGYCFMEGHTDPKVTKVVDYSRTNAEACIFIGYWRLGDPAKTTSVTEPAISAHAKNFSMTSWNGASRDYAFVFLPSGVTKTNDLPHFDGAYHIVVAKAVDAATRSSAELPGDFLLTALTAMASPSPYYELSGVWTPALTISITPLGNVGVSEGVAGIEPALMMSTSAPALDQGAALPPVWTGGNNAPTVLAGDPKVPNSGDLKIYPEPNIDALPKDGSGVPFVDAFVRRDRHLNFSVRATDGEGDVPYCRWSDALTSGSGPPNGTFSVAGEVEMEWSQAQSKYLSSVQWTPPPNAVAGEDYTITLAVSDRKGGTATLSRKIRIMEGKIFFTSNRDVTDEIYVMNPDGTEQTRMTNNSWEDFAPVCSPDGTKIAFFGAGEIYMMNADGSGFKNLTNNPSSFEGYPSWSPDGTKLAYSHERIRMNVMNADGTGMTAVVGTPPYYSSWSPDGTKIVFAAGPHLNEWIYVINADGTGMAKLTDHPLGVTGDCYPAWSPDGTKIAFSSSRSSIWRIYVMNPDGTGQTSLTNGSTQDLSPSWSPDGTRIAFSRGAGDPASTGLYEIYIMNSDGTEQMRLTNNNGRNLYPSWSREVRTAPATGP
jgi:type II secretory pathway pseudopilin PulG